ncbi:Uncharacterized protein dnm_051710 [Desulfonema magnum]|uniref:Uncharacterized protein n=1 Tax=Desulfonema magnum TaxID=45655 RepID=A0A975BP84_9BACT|nr:Uncharacterized protein dnm_051710 [Desulfonema magnum]
MSLTDNDNFFSVLSIIIPLSPPDKDDFFPSSADMKVPSCAPSGLTNSVRMKWVIGHT